MIVHEVHIPMIVRSVRVAASYDDAALVPGTQHVRTDERRHRLHPVRLSHLTCRNKQAIQPVQSPHIRFERVVVFMVVHPFLTKTDDPQI